MFRDRQAVLSGSRCSRGRGWAGRGGAASRGRGRSLIESLHSLSKTVSNNPDFYRAHHACQARLQTMLPRRFYWHTKALHTIFGLKKSERVVDPFQSFSNQANSLTLLDVLVSDGEHLWLWSRQRLLRRRLKHRKQKRPMRLKLQQMRKPRLKYLKRPAEATEAMAPKGAQGFLLSWGSFFLLFSVFLLVSFFSSVCIRLRQRNLEILLVRQSRVCGDCFMDQQWSACQSKSISWVWFYDWAKIPSAELLPELFRWQHLREVVWFALQEVFIPLEEEDYEREALGEGLHPHNQCDVCLTK